MSTISSVCTTYVNIFNIINKSIGGKFSFLPVPINSHKSKA